MPRSSSLLLTTSSNTDRVQLDVRLRRGDAA
eukprot:CAMPEP_0196754578 /NCGR_PEP_ID=MMETSP1091-20130531/94409_1 /TAXON_ID=302021 /ORGANISM="Rhodomonas sp., Strain CCMP768" /LENGTH=30 /DNA_ID= /DNA_START= /DNA_END= /DNA_ORIENTATION=